MTPHWMDEEYHRRVRRAERRAEVLFWVLLCLGMGLLCGLAWLGSGAWIYDHPAADNLLKEFYRRELTL